MKWKYTVTLNRQNNDPTAKFNSILDVQVVYIYIKL